MSKLCEFSLLNAFTPVCLSECQLSGYGLKDVIHLHKLGIKALLGFENEMGQVVQCKEFYLGKGYKWSSCECVELYIKPFS